VVRAVVFLEGCELGLKPVGRVLRHIGKLKEGAKERFLVE
jgi:hypothetical protein